MKERLRRRSYLLPIVIASGLLLPALTLLPFGTLWLWQKGYLLHWAVGAACLVAIATLVQRRVLRSLAPTDDGAAASEPRQADDLVDASWTPAEAQAWSDVLAVAQRVDVASLTSREAILALGGETVRTVAKRLHPAVAEPLWQFTVPEAFAIIERVSRRLGAFTSETIPFSDRLTVGRVMSLYNWRGAVNLAEKAYDVWRLVRLVNPFTALTHELRERLSKQMLAWGQAQITQRLAHAYVLEVGRAAIDLYGGRLRVAARQVHAEMSTAAAADTADIDRRTIEPLRILVAGQIGAGKSSVVNALANEIHATVDALPATSQFTAYALRRDGFPGAHLIDSPGLGATPDERKIVIDRAMDCDLVLWVVAAHRADRDLDRLAISELRRAFENVPNRRRPPLVLVLTHIDRLRPFQEWSPPYDLESIEQLKSQSIRAAVDVIAKELEVEPSDVIPVSVGQRTSYNIDALWACMLIVLPDAQRAQLVRRLHDARSEMSWRRVWSQAVSAGRVLRRSLGA